MGIFGEADLEEMSKFGVFEVKVWKRKAKIGVLEWKKLGKWVKFGFGGRKMGKKEKNWELGGKNEGKKDKFGGLGGKLYKNWGFVRKVRKKGGKWNFFGGEMRGKRVNLGFCEGKTRGKSGIWGF